MPQVTLVQKQHNRSVLLRAVAAAGALVVVVVLVFAVMAMMAAAKHKSIVKQEQQLQAQGNFSGETSVLASYINSKPPKQYQYDILVKLGDLSFTARQYSAASEWYFRAYALRSKPDLHVITQLAAVSGKLGDKANATKYYKQAIVMTPAKDYQQVGIYQDDIRGLGGTP